MQTFTAMFTTTAMLLAALALTSLTGRSICASRRWQSEIKRVGQGLKDHSGPVSIPANCLGPRVHWAFRGALHDA
jgi:hypothetical protein